MGSSTEKAIVMGMIDFLWLVHIGLLGLYFYEIGYYIYLKKNYPDTVTAVRKFAEDNNKNIIELHSLDDEKIRGAIFLFGGHIFSYGLAIDSVPIFLMILMAAAVYLGAINDTAKPLVRKIKRGEPFSSSKKSDSDAGFGKTHNNDGFDYEESAFSDHGSTHKDAPRGWDKRHPDDAQLWAVVDDPAASNGEQSNALSAIQKRRAKRNGKPPA